MRILIICLTINPKNLAASYRVLKFLKYFKKKNISFSVISSDEPSDVPNIFKGHHLYVPYIPLLRQRKNFIGRLVNRLLVFPEPEYLWAKKVYKEYLTKFKNNYHDVMLVSSPPHSIQYSGVIINRETGIPYYADLRDDWLTNHSLRFHTIIHKLVAKNLEKLVVEGAVKTFLNTTKVKNNFSHRYPSIESKFITLTNGYDEDDFVDESTFLDDFKFSGKHSIVYAGGGYGGYIEENIFKLCRSFRSLGLEKTWHIYTAGQLKVRTGEFDDVWTHFGVLSHADVSRLLQNSNLLLLPMFPGEKEPSGTVQLKAYSYLRSMSSIIYLGEIGSTSELLGKFPGTFCFNRAFWEKLPKFIVDNKEKLLIKHTRIGIEDYCFEKLTSDLLNNMEITSVSPLKN